MATSEMWYITVRNPTMHEDEREAERQWHSRFSSSIMEPRIRTIRKEWRVYHHVHTVTTAYRATGQRVALGSSCHSWPSYARTKRFLRAGHPLFFAGST